MFKSLAVCGVLLCCSSVCRADNAIYGARGVYVGRYAVNQVTGIRTFFDARGAYVGRNETHGLRVQSYDAHNRYLGSFALPRDTIRKEKKQRD